MSDEQPSPSWWSRLVNNKRAVAGALGAGLLFICPLLPPQARGPCELARLVVHVGQQLMNGDELQQKPSCEPEVACTSIAGIGYDSRLLDGGVCSCPAR